MRDHLRCYEPLPVKQPWPVLETIMTIVLVPCGVIGLVLILMAIAS